MDALLNGLTGNHSEAEETTNTAKNNTTADAPRRGRKKSEVKSERICTIISSELMNKVRTNAYEEKHGPVRVKQPKKGDVESVFDL